MTGSEPSVRRAVIFHRGIWPGRWGRNVALVVAVLALAASVQATGLSPTERAGQQIYQRGTSPAGTVITAVVGRDGTSLPASLLPCVNCHGEDGKGGEGGAVRAADITWGSLTQPAVRDGGRGTRGPYTIEALRRMIRTGRGPGGDRLQASMPRYRIGDRDLDSLIAYLQHLDRD